MQKTLASYLIVCSSSFFLGILFNNWMVDHFTLWINPVTDQALNNAETYYRLLYQTPSIYKIILHVVICFGFFAHIMKLYGGNQSNLLFDSGSLILYIAGIIIYIVYLVQGLQTIFEHTYTPYNKLDTLQILAASQVALALVLIGILVLQSSQFCAEQAVLHSPAFNKCTCKNLYKTENIYCTRDFNKKANYL